MERRDATVRGHLGELVPETLTRRHWQCEHELARRTRSGGIPGVRDRARQAARDGQVLVGNRIHGG